MNNHLILNDCIQNTTAAVCNEATGASYQESQQQNFSDSLLNGYS